jgi:hypothetical protein
MQVNGFIFIVGELNVEYTMNLAPKLSASQRQICKTHIMPGGSAYRQSIYGKECGYNIILVGCIGRDYYGRIVEESLNKNNISTAYLQECVNGRTALSFKKIVDQELAFECYDPGIYWNDTDLRLPLQYLSLCRVTLINQMSNLTVTRRTLQILSQSSSLCVFVQSNRLETEEWPLPDYVFVEDPQESIDSNLTGVLSAKKGIFIHTSTDLRALKPGCGEIYRIKLNKAHDSNFVLLQLINALEKEIDIPDALLIKSVI